MIGMFLWKEPQGGLWQRQAALSEKNILHMRFLCAEVVRGPRTPEAALRRRTAAAAISPFLRVWGRLERRARKPFQDFRLDVLRGLAIFEDEILICARVGDKFALFVYEAAGECRQKGRAGFF